MIRPLLACLSSALLLMACGGPRTIHSMHDHVQWSYMGPDGPEYWGDLSDDFALCCEGESQSPIDLRDAQLITGQALECRYRPTPLHVVNNGHTIQVNVLPGTGELITPQGTRYELAQFHFHTLSEHTIDGQWSDMEVHLVHRNAGGDLAVVGVMLEAGTHHELIADVWAQVPAAGDESRPTGLTIDPTHLLPRDAAFYHYDGSLTMPPCSEGVKWFVMRSPVQISSGQISTFRNLYRRNNRPIQPLHGRPVKLYSP